MTWATREDNTCLRARQLRRFYEKHISSEGPLKYADKITQSDIDLATALAPDYSLELCAKGEQEYPEQWALKPKSLSFILSNFRPKAKEFKAAMDNAIEAAMTEEVTDIPPVFLGDNGDRAHIRFLVLLTDRLKQLLQEAKEETEAAEEEAEQYLARAEKAEAELKKLLEELEEEDDESEEGEEGEEEDEDEGDRRRKKRKIDEASDEVRETIHCSLPGASTRK
ncbi:hypothetical protein FPHYL_6188 [Fusarium phyllophilum]|uniref:Uncharacterized protein n=1 Tax=Fusarium phyllophilum TaxID=47803 RepID=A0A8H5JUM2_9HYPO|nr:hypothetical protein FPHYL_6188 [Fusarium phyllophilum]